MDGLFLFCEKCKKKVIISKTIKCKCDFRFCFLCRTPEVHGCIFSYRMERTKELNEILKKHSKKKLSI